MPREVPRPVVLANSGAGITAGEGAAVMRGGWRACWTDPLLSRTMATAFTLADRRRNGRRASFLPLPACGAIAYGLAGPVERDPSPCKGRVRTRTHLARCHNAAFRDWHLTGHAADVPKSTQMTHRRRRPSVTCRLDGQFLLSLGSHAQVPTYRLVAGSVSGVNTMSIIDDRRKHLRFFAEHAQITRSLASSLCPTGL
jgi:hypothetical protein